MKLYEVYNGYEGYTSIRVMVIAENEERAFFLASEKFKENARNPRRDKENYFFSEEAEEFLQPEIYWTRLEVVLITDNLTVEWAGEVIEE